jgi:hypothetical protein
MPERQCCDAADESMTALRSSPSAPHEAAMASANILGGRLPGLPALPGLIAGNWALIQRSDLDAWLTRLEALEARYRFAGLRDDELEFIAGA